MKIVNEDINNEIIVKPYSGYKADGFIVIKDGNETGYYYGKNASYKKENATKNAPYVGDILTDLSKEGKLKFEDGKYLFNGEVMPKEKISNYFKEALSKEGSLSRFISEIKSLARSDKYRYYAFWTTSWEYPEKGSNKIQPVIYSNKGKDYNTIKFEFNGEDGPPRVATFKEDLQYILNNTYPELKDIIKIKDSGSRSPSVSVMYKKNIDESLNEDFTYSNEDIFSGIEEVYDKMNEVSSALYALSTYLEDYPKLMKSIDMCINYFSDWSNYFNGEAEDIKKELNPPEEDELDESFSDYNVGDLVMFSTKDMKDDPPKVGQRFKVGPLTGTCTKNNGDYVQMHVESNCFKESLKEQIINEAPAGKIGKQIAKMVQSGMEFDDAVEKATSNRDISDSELNWAKKVAKDILGDNIVNNNKWQYEVNSKLAKSLRDAIEDGNIDDVKTYLSMVWEDIADNTDLLDDSELEDTLLDIEMVEDDEDELDYLLEDLYDFCDNTRIWIPA